MTKFINPWADSPSFIDLGPYCPPTRMGDRPRPVDLYALVQTDGTVEFGARYSNNGEDYISGHLTDGMRGGIEMVAAHAAYFKYIMDHSNS